MLKILEKMRSSEEKYESAQHSPSPSWGEEDF